ncbi:hypothetical protein K469DRAFT_685711 [Zopfia rhizophila CBS 207.26]|uniref:Uncharacterized protein n=1 Tax=Zopfia rhizophila CBS 207.26 TaxID=1314779 RepID=A0A6A6EAM9_9PEZI|nr:hypothetical protein K469DRAFT_685711 [Zopfia rhizophila CBS 207.26]
MPVTVPASTAFPNTTAQILPISSNLSTNYTIKPPKDMFTTFVIISKPTPSMLSPNSPLTSSSNPPNTAHAKGLAMGAQVEKKKAMRRKQISQTAAPPRMLRHTGAFSLTCWLSQPSPFKLAKTFYLSIMLTLNGVERDGRSCSDEQSLFLPDQLVARLYPNELAGATVRGYQYGPPGKSSLQQQWGKIIFWHLGLSVVYWGLTWAQRDFDLHPLPWSFEDAAPGLGLGRQQIQVTHK